MTLRWGVLGTGDISARLVPDLQAVAPGSVAAVWGRTPERAEAFAVAHGISFATHRREALFSRSDVDIVYIATPAETHADIAIEALAAGKHVLVEKPMATSAADVERIFAHAGRAGLFAMEAMWMRFNPLHQAVMRRIEDGLIGEVRSVRASFGTPFQARGNKMTPAQGGSILLDRGIYPVALAQWALGSANVVSASQTLSDYVDVDGHATLAFDKDRFAHVAWSGVDFLDLSASISGQHGWVTFAPMFWAGTTAYLHAGTAQRIFSDPERLEYPRAGHGYQPMLAAVQQAVLDGYQEHPIHDRRNTVDLARVLDEVVACSKRC